MQNMIMDTLKKEETVSIKPEMFENKTGEQLMISYRQHG